MPAQTATRRVPTKGLIGIAVVLVIAAAIIGYIAFFLPFDVTVNGQTVSMRPRSTVASLVEQGHANPRPGNLLSVNGQLLQPDGGEPFSAKVDGEPAEPGKTLAAGMVVEIGDGNDVVEDFTQSEEPLPFGRSDDDRSFESYWQGSIHMLQDGQDGLLLTKTGSISGATVQEVAVPAVDAGYHIFTVQPSEKVIALTFDDGPWPETTDQILDILAQNNAKATFFTIGMQIPEYSASVRRAAQMGCQVLTHSWDHASGSGNGVDLTIMSDDEQIEEVTRGYAAIAEATGAEPAHIMRAPGGNFHDSIIDTLWPYLDAEIGWDVDTQDWSRPGVDSIVESLLSVEPGQVVLMHDGGGDRSQTVEALRQALPILAERGYRFVTISELLSSGA